MEKDSHGSLLTLAEFLNYPSCTLSHHTTDDRVVSDDSTSDTEQKSMDFNLIQEMKIERTGMNVSDLKDTDKDIYLFGEAGLQPANSCSQCTKSRDQSPISVKASLADYISLQIEENRKSEHIKMTCGGNDWA